MTLAQFAEIYARLRYTLSGDDLRELEELERRVALAGPAGGVFSGNVSAAAQNPAASTPQNPVLRPLQQAAGAALPPNILHHLVHNAERLRAGMGPGLVAANANPAAQNSAATMPQNLGQLPSLLAGARTPHGGQQPSQAAVRPPNSAQQPLQAGGGSAPGTLPRRFYGTANAAVQNPAASTPQPRPEDTTTGGTAPNANTPPPNPSPPTPLNRAQRTSQSASKSRVRRRVEVEQSDDEMDGIERDRALPTPKRAKGKKTEAQLAAEKAAKAEQRKRDREERERLKEEQKKRELIAKHGEEGYARLLEANRKRRETLEVKRRAKEAEEEKKTKELAKEMTKEMEQREKQLARELERVKNEAEEAKTRAAALERARAAAPLASTPATTAAATAESETASPIPATLDEEELANVANVIRLGFPAETVRAVAQDLAAKWKRVTAELLVDVLTSGVPDEEPEEPKPQPPSQQQEDPSCVICLDNPPTHALIPCGHRVLCDDCIGLRLEECPICRTARQGVLRIFL